MDISVLVYVLLIIAFAKALGEVVSRINQPSIVGELLAGIILGPFLLGKIFSELNLMYTNEFVQGLADLGILLLMLYIGLEFSPKRLVSATLSSTVMAVTGILLPMALGFATGYLFNLRGASLVFLSLAVGVTALPVTIRILKDMEVVPDRHRREDHQCRDDNRHLSVVRDGGRHRRRDGNPQSGQDVLSGHGIHPVLRPCVSREQIRDPSTVPSTQMDADGRGGFRCGHWGRDCICRRGQCRGPSELRRSFHRRYDPEGDWDRLESVGESRGHPFWRDSWIPCTGILRAK